MKGYVHIDSNKPEDRFQTCLDSLQKITSIRTMPDLLIIELFQSVSSFFLWIAFGFKKDVKRRIIFSITFLFLIIYYCILNFKQSGIY